ncbi:uncharacterized protein LOC109727081 isoform X2 [Ananas comosus]|uniref:Uncharacterized protein LOC109727081 isoform X2 n=1 Tax=Ananas comosus TaxID=4615 RepID=A0A6P5GXJ0_ANACO|nr:uncharacterized protein LOC109727081 isoform X2 [Ananas comosus]
MGKGRPRAVEKGGAAHLSDPSSSAAAASSSSAASCGGGDGGGGVGVPHAPVFYPTEEEFVDPLAYIDQIRPLAEPFGICRIVPPKSWAPPFALDLASFSFPTKSQAINCLQARPPSCDPDTFRLEYRRFLTSHLGRKPKRNPVFDGEELDLCRLFNAVKRFGGYDKVCAKKRWGDVIRLVRPARPYIGGKISECSKHVLSQLYWEHLYEYEEYTGQLDRGIKKPPRKRRRKNSDTAENAVTVVNEQLDQVCEQCKSGLHGDVMLLCDRCDKGWHLYCLSPPLESIPSGNWYCLQCVNSDKDSFGFVPRRKKCTVEVFKRLDERVRRKWFGQKDPTRLQIEKRFWEIVEGRAGEVEVMYGSDLDTSLYGSGFPRDGDPVPSSLKPDVWRDYCSSPWNLNNFPKLPGSMLRAVQENVAGVMVPWLYIGMLFSSFCWHVEDHCFYSINYLHWGEPKFWYGVPGTEANAFEQVMQSALPDLFDAQPDLLFQLVTMLNPSVLQENGVPVYSVVQEPGNFVITFPRSFHGGFNFGLNCAEAVNFAPADWLPHGGVGAELYRLYHKAPVISHEELLYVVAKDGSDTKALPYLKGELERVFMREKRCREELWINGIVKSSFMSPKSHPEFVGTEEDPTCIICKQYLYLSAITCSCRPATYVCLEHWKHLCECSPDKHHFVYRHTLAELGDLVHLCSPTSKTTITEEITQYPRWHRLIPSEQSAMIKKVKGGTISYTQLAEDWLSNSYHILEKPFSDAAYNTVLKDAEQFLWADHSMDPVRDMVNKLTEAQKWAIKVRSSLSIISDNVHSKNKRMKKVMFNEVKELLSFNPLPCCEPEITKLEAYAADASKLVAKISNALSSRLNISELEELHSKAAAFPINLTEAAVLESEISSAKLWLKNVRDCLSEKNPGIIEIDFFNKLKSEMLQLHVQLPEMDLLLNLCTEADSWKERCQDYLNGPLNLKELEKFLLAAENVRVSIPELKILRQHYSDSCSWICRCNNVLQNLNERDDHMKNVEELSRILKDGESLHIQGEELAAVELELNKSMCRKRASEALSLRTPLEIIQQVLAEASLLEIDTEQLFIEISRVLRAAISWEERARFVLEHVSCISEFEGLIRASEDIFAILPSFPDIEDAVSVARRWMLKSQPYLGRTICDKNSFELMLKVDDLKDLVGQSRYLKVNLDTPQRLQNILLDVEKWMHKASNLLENIRSLLYMNDADFIVNNCLKTKIQQLLNEIDSTRKIGISLGFEFKELPELQHASLTMKWALVAISFCFMIPLLKEVDRLLKDMDHIPAVFSGSNLVKRLLNITRWLRKALVLLPDPQISKRCNVKDVENFLEESQEVEVPHAMMVSRLKNAIETHRSWIDRCHAFFISPGKQSWGFLLELKESGKSNAFDCPEMDKVVSEIEKVEKWMLQCRGFVQPLVGDLGSLSSELLKIQRSLDKALCLYGGSSVCTRQEICVCCPNDTDNERVYTCLICEDRFHFSCMWPTSASADMKNKKTCLLCLSIEKGDAALIGRLSWVSKGKRPKFNSFVKLISVANSFYTRVEELDLLKEIVEQALKCKSYLTQIVIHAISYREKDLSSISESLLLAVKALTVSGVYDRQDSLSLESALTEHSWKIRTNKLLRASRKPNIYQIQHLEKAGSALGIPSGDHFMMEIINAKKTSLHWLANAKQVTSDSGKLALSEVYKLISEGESLPVHFDTELKLLKVRSELYCICRKPDDKRAMIACDQCDEWYHFDCINLCKPLPKAFYCPACFPANGEFISLLRSASREHSSLLQPVHRWRTRHASGLP